MRTVLERVLDCLLLCGSLVQVVMAKKNKLKIEKAEKKILD